MTTELVKSKSKKAALENKLKSHDKSGTSKRSKLMFATPLIGSKNQETSSGLRNRINAFPSSKAAHQALVDYYKRLGYKRIGNRELQLGDEPILVLPKKSKMIRMKQGKGGRAMAPDARSGIIL